MYKIKDRHKYDIYLEMLGYETLNIRGVLRNTNYNAFVDDLEEPSGIYIEDGYFYFIFSENDNFIKAFDHVIKDKNFFGISGCNKKVYTYFSKHYEIDWSSICHQYHYSGPSIKKNDHLESLKLSDADFVNDNYEYKNDFSLEKLKNAIENRPSSCLRQAGQLVSFVLIHDDDSIGYMYTVPSHRNKGYAYDLTKDIVSKVIESGRLPYVQIVDGNTKSESLAEKTNFTKHGDVYWFGVKR